MNGEMTTVDSGNIGNIGNIGNNVLPIPIPDKTTTAAGPNKMEIDLFNLHKTTIDPSLISMIPLLSNDEVVRWLFGDLSFLPVVDESSNKTKDTEKRKQHEDDWGKTVMKKRRPDLELKTMWTPKFGEHLCEEMYTLLGHTIKSAKIIDTFKPDFEIQDAILEAKIQTYYTTGTAGEKILGSPFKYAEVPTLYGKPLQIVVMGGAEMHCVHAYGNLPGPKLSPAKQVHLEFLKENGITFVGASNLLRTISKRAS